MLTLMLETDAQEAVSLRQAYASSHSFAHFNFALSDAEMEARERLKIGRAGTYNNFGNIPALEDEVANFIVSLGTVALAAKHIAQLISRLTNEALLTFNAETAWMTLRASLPNNSFDTPRWHMDGYFFHPYSGDQRKVAITLIGPGTLFNHLARESRQAFRECARHHQHAPLALEGREALVRIVNAGGGFERAGAMQGTIFAVGSAERAAIHSEPMIDSERLFLSLVPGSREQISELHERWGAPLQTKG